MRSLQKQIEDQATRELEETEQCNGAVMNCPEATEVVWLPNTFQVWKYGNKAYCKFCSKCLRKSPTMNPPLAEKDSAKQWDAVWIEQLRKRRTERRNELYKALAKAREEMTEIARSEEENEWRTRYELHLKSSAWQEKRRLVIKRCGNLCEGCRTYAVDEIHHLTYKNLGDELLFQLVGLCSLCHSKLHPQE